MSVLLPLRNDLPHYSFQASLDGTTYGFEFLWNAQMEAWVMSVFTADDEPVITGLALVVDWQLTGRYVDARLPPGQLVAQDTTGARQNPGRYDLGTRTTLLYFTAEELAST